MILKEKLTGININQKYQRKKSNQHLDYEIDESC